MTSFPFGQNVELVIGPVLNDGVTTDPATLTATITLPDTTTSVVNIGGLTRDSLGLYHLDYLPPQSGSYRWRAVATVPNWSHEDGFEVAASGSDIAGPVDLGEFKDFLNLKDNTGPGGDRELVGFLNTATRLISFYVGQILPAPKTETCSGGQTQIALSNWVRSVTSIVEVSGSSVSTITEQPLSSDPSTWDGYGYTVNGAILTRRSNGTATNWAAGDDNIVVTYTAGVPDEDMPLVIEAIYELGQHFFATQQGSRTGKMTDWAPAPYAMPRRIVEKLAPLDLGPRVA